MSIKWGVRAAKPSIATIVADARQEAVISAAIGDAAETLGVTSSEVVESILTDALLPSHPAARRVAESVYIGELSIRGAIAGEFAEDAAVVDWSARADGRAERMLCDFAAMASSGSMVNPDAPDGMGGKIVHHAHDCWDSVVRILEDRLADGDVDDPRALELDVAEARGLLEALGEGAPPIEAERYYLLVVRQWPSLMTSTYAYRSLYDIARMSGAWLECGEARIAFASVIDAVYSWREG